MTSKRESEPYTFVGAMEIRRKTDAVHCMKGRCVIVSPEPRLAISCSCNCPECGGPSLKSSVAAHQAECGCHAETDCAIGPNCFGLKFEGAPFQAKDSSGQTWHVDPLCKVRPEAKG